MFSTDNQVRVFRPFATLNLLLQGRAALTVGRGSATDAYPLFGSTRHEYDALFAGKLSLLL